MYATIQPVRSGLLVLEPVDGGDVFAVALSQDPPGTPDAYHVMARTQGIASGRQPLFAQVNRLNDAGDPAVAAAAERGGRERVEPAVRDLDGYVGTLVLRSADHRIVVIALATALETFDAARRAIMATELLPGEDPAMLPGPDSIERARVLLAELPVEVRS
jgi:hypothetical protein